MTTDLNMTGRDYNVALFVFFIPVGFSMQINFLSRQQELSCAAAVRTSAHTCVQYILFEIPSNIVIKKMAPSTWLSIIMVLWGECARVLERIQKGS